MKLSFAFAAVALVGTAAVAQDAAPAPAAKPVKEKKICRSEIPTGSFMAKTTCHTKDEWSRIDAANASSAGDFGDQRRRSGGGMGR